MYCVRGSSWNSSFTTTHIWMSLRRIMSSNMPCRFSSHPSRTRICSDQEGIFGTLAC